MARSATALKDACIYILFPVYPQVYTKFEGKFIL